jgi:mannosyltransferase
VNRPSVARRLSGPLSLWLVLLAAFGLRIYGLGAQSLWYDEAFSVILARAELPTALLMLSADFHPPLYYLVLRAGIALFGSSEFAVRFVSLVPSLAMAPLIWALARRLFDRPTGWLAAGLVSLSPLLVWYAGEARMYSQAAAFGLASTYALVRAQDKGQARWWVTFAACALGAIYSHYSALYLVAALGMFWLIDQLRLSTPGCANRQRAFRPGIWAWGAVAIGVLAIAPHLLGVSQASHGYWPGRLDMPSALAEAVRVLIAGDTATPPLSFALVFLCGVLSLAAVLDAVAWPSSRRGVWLASLLPLAGTALAFAVLYQRPKFEPRHLMALAPAMWLLVAAGLGALRRMRGRGAKTAVGLAAVALMGGLAALDWGILAGNGPRDDWRGAVAFLRQNIRPGEALVLVSGHAFPALEYYHAPSWVALPDDPVLDVTHVLDYQAVAPVLNRIQSERRGAWLVLWQEDIVDPTRVVTALLSDMGTEQPVGMQFTGLRLRHFVFDRPAPLPADPPMARRLDQSPLPGLMALGVTLAPQPLPADAPLVVRMFWRADTLTPGAASGSLRIMDEGGQEWARRDELLGGLFLSERWPLGQAVMGQYTITLPAGAPPGRYVLRQVVYRGDQSGELELGQVMVTRPVHAPDAVAFGVSPAGLARLGDLTLLAAGLDVQALKPCETLFFTLFWRSERLPWDDYALRVTLAGHSDDQPLAPGLPTSQWRPGDVWRTRHHVAVPCRAPDGAAELQLTLVDSSGRPVVAPVGAGTVSINGGRTFSVPTMQHAQKADLGPVSLLGYDLSSDTLRPGQSAQLVLYWQATLEMTTSLAVFTHVEGERVWGQHDGLPAAGFNPTDGWIPGEVVADRHTFTLDPATPPGRYRLVAGMYDPISQTRLPAFDETGQRWPGDAILLQEIVVAR